MHLRIDSITRLTRMEGEAEGARTLSDELNVYSLLCLIYIAVC